MKYAQSHSQSRLGNTAIFCLSKSVSAKVNESGIWRQMFIYSRFMRLFWNLNCWYFAMSLQVCLQDGYWGFFCLSGLKKHKLDTSGISCNKSYPAEPVHLKCLCLQSLENSGVHEINQPWLSSLALYQISRFRRRIHGKAWKTTHHEW